MYRGQNAVALIPSQDPETTSISIDVLNEDVVDAIREWQWRRHESYPDPFTITTTSIELGKSLPREVTQPYGSCCDSCFVVRELRDLPYPPSYEVIYKDDNADAWILYPYPPRVSLVRRPSERLQRAIELRFKIENLQNTVIESRDIEKLASICSKDLFVDGRIETT
jgi:hypothetical protein